MLTYVASIWLLGHASTTFFSHANTSWYPSENTFKMTEPCAQAIRE